MDQRKRARDLIELAADEKTPDGERFAAAMRAVILIKKYDLISSPLEGLAAIDNETIRTAADIFERLSDPTLVSGVKKILGSFKKRRR